MKKEFYITPHPYFKSVFGLFFLLATTNVEQAFSQSAHQDNKKAHLIQWIPLRVLPDFHQVKLFYEYQPAASKISYGVAPSIRMGGKSEINKTFNGTSQIEINQTAVELQPFVNIIRRHPKSEFYAQFFLKACYFNQYDAIFETKKYYHSTFFFPGTGPDIIYQPKDFYSFGGGCLAGYRKFFGGHWFMDINIGLQYLAHTKVEFPEELSNGGRPYIKWSNFYSFPNPGFVYTGHLGFGYRFIKK
jgi:hypothetical protein